MRLVKWTDEDGFLRHARVRDDDRDEDAQSIGIPADPPDLGELDWRAIQRELHNELAERGLFTWRDVQRAQNAVSSAVRRVVTKRIIELYKLQEVD